MSLAAFGAVIARRPFLLWTMNSLIVGVAAAAVSLVAASLAGYALSRWSFRFVKFSGAALLLGKLAPPALIIIPLFIMFNLAGLIDTYAGLVLANVATGVPLLRTLRKAGSNAKFVAADAMCDASAVRDAQGAADRNFFCTVAGVPPSWLSAGIGFTEMYKARFGAPGAYSTLAYDGIHILAQAMQEAANETMARLQDAASAARVASTESQAAADRRMQVARRRDHRVRGDTQLLLGENLHERLQDDGASDVVQQTAHEGVFDVAARGARDLLREHGGRYRMLEQRGDLRLEALELEHADPERDRQRNFANLLHTQACDGLLQRRDLAASAVHG